MWKIQFRILWLNDTWILFLHRWATKIRDSKVPQYLAARVKNPLSPGDWLKALAVICVCIIIFKMLYIKTYEKASYREYLNALTSFLRNKILLTWLWTLLPPQVAAILSLVFVILVHFFQFCHVWVLGVIFKVLNNGWCLGTATHGGCWLLTADAAMPECAGCPQAQQGRYSSICKIAHGIVLYAIFRVPLSSPTLYLWDACMLICITDSFIFIV